jgi:hypothetical protein
MPQFKIICNNYFVFKIFRRKKHPRKPLKDIGGKVGNLRRKIKATQFCRVGDKFRLGVCQPHDDAEQHSRY